MPKEQLEGRSLFELYPKEEAEAFWSDDKQVIASGKAKVGIEEKMHSKQGQRWVQTDKIPYRDAEGNIIGVIGFSVDITERKNSEEALLKAKEQTEFERKRLETILETTPSAVVIIDAHSGKFSYVNKRAAQLYGFDTIGLSLDENVAKVKARRANGTEYPIEEMPVSRSLKLGQEVHNEEMMIERADGQVIPIVASTGPLRDMQGNITAAIVVFEDITERKNAEQALSRINEELEERVQKRTQQVSSERQRLYNVLETLPAYVVLLDKDYRMPFANKVFRETFGESHGRRCHEYLFGRDSECENCETYKVLKTNKPQHWEWTGPNGHDYEIYDYPFVEADGSNLILEMGLDVTERKRAERQAQEATKKLKDAERLAAIGATAGMVGHDIRNPLQAITGDLYLAKTELAALPANEQKINILESLEEIEQNIDYINKIVADLQDYARPLNPRATRSKHKIAIQ